MQCYTVIINKVPQVGGVFMWEELGEVGLLPHKLPAVISPDSSGYAIIRKSLIYSMRKAFLERAVVDLVYKFDEKSTASV